MREITNDLEACLTFEVTFSNFRISSNHIESARLYENAPPHDRDCALLLRDFSQTLNRKVFIPDSLAFLLASLKENLSTSYTDYFDDNINHDSTFRSASMSELGHYLLIFTREEIEHRNGFTKDVGEAHMHAVLGLIGQQIKDSGGDFS